MVGCANVTCQNSVPNAELLTNTSESPRAFIIPSTGVAFVPAIAPDELVVWLKATLLLFISYATNCEI
jgi:hypothetical protein